MDFVGVVRIEVTETTPHELFDLTLEYEVGQHELKIAVAQLDALTKFV